MYRDLVTAPECCTAGGRDWWVRVLHHWDGTVDTVILYDDNGDYVCEFDSLRECEDWLVDFGKEAQ